MKALGDLAVGMLYPFWRFRLFLANKGVSRLTVSSALLESYRATLLSKKYSHTRLQALGSKLIPFLGSQPAGDLVINPVVGCHYFAIGKAVTFPAEEIALLAGTKLYCLVTEAHRCK